MSAARGTPGPWLEVLASLAQHRVLTSRQVLDIHLPDRNLRSAQRLLARLWHEGLAANAPRLRAQRVWFVTERGIDVLRSAGALDGEPKLLDASAAVGQLQAHTLAVNDAAIAFTTAARERGEEFGALSWRHEVAHPLSASRGRRVPRLIADAVLTYLRSDGEDLLLEQRFLELDRATLSVDRLTAELGRYPRLYRASDGEGKPLWRSRYPSFPAVLCVLDGAPRRLLLRRRDTACALLRADPELSRSPSLAIRFCLAGELAERGPFSPIFAEVGDPRRAVNWLGEPESGGKG